MASVAGVLLAFAASSLPAAERPGQGVGNPELATAVGGDARLLGYQPFDGAGRYRMDQADGVREVQGLATLAARHGLKPYDLLGRDGRWQTERVLFTDVATGATVCRLTCDPFADELSYFKGNVSADGSTVVFRRRPGMWEGSTATHGPMAMNADGTGLRNVFRDFRLVRKHVTSFTDPAVCYAIADEKKIVAFNLQTGKLDHEVADIRDCWWLKASPDGRYLMGRGTLASGQKGIYIVRADGRAIGGADGRAIVPADGGAIGGADGKERFDVPIPEAIHDSYQFHPTLRKMMYWYEGKFYAEGFMQRDFDGGSLTRVNVQFDWNHGDCGLDRGAHTEGYITRIDGNTWKPREWLFKADPNAEYYDDPADLNGYLAWRPKDEPWAFATRIVARPHLSEVMLMALEPVPGDVVNRFRICYTNLHRKAALDNPESSPDGTRVYFNSTMLNSCSVYMAVARNPSPPSGVTGSWTGQGASLAWSPPKHHAETRGYRVYRSEESGRGYREVTRPLAGSRYPPVAATSFVDRSAEPGKAFFYVVTSEEHSGLESLPSAEVGVAPDPAALAAKPVRIFAEAESGAHGPAGTASWREVWRAFHGTASDLYFVWTRKKDAAGKVTIPVSVPRDGRYRVWVRACSLAAPSAELMASAGASAARGQVQGRAWSWVALAGELVLPRGNRTLDLDLPQYGTAIDAVYLATDNAPPTDAPRLPGLDPAASVTGLKAEPLGPFAVRLSWNPVQHPRLHHYNVYVVGGPSLARETIDAGHGGPAYNGRQEDFQPGRATLVASPEAAGYVDWSLSPGTAYTYRVTAVDRNGLEIVSPAARVTTAPLSVQKIELACQKDVPADFEVAEDGQYVVWLRLALGKGQGSYLDLVLDDARKATWTIQPDQLSEEMWYRYNEYAVFPLARGRHRLALANKTPHKVLKLFITNDLSLSPEGHINMPKGW